MKPAAFAYERAASLSEALQWLHEHPDAKVLAGGQSLIPLMNFRLSRPQELLDINPLSELSYIEQNGNSLRLGSLVHHQELHLHPVVKEVCPVLSEAAGHVGHWAIRNRGTLGGSLVHADPASELPAVMVALKAEFNLASTEGTRTVSASDFYLGFLTTDIRPDELLVSVDIPIVEGVSYGFQEYARRPGDFALAGAIVEIRNADSDSADATGSGKQMGAVTWFGIGGAPIREEVEFLTDDAARMHQLKSIVDTLDIDEEGLYRKQLAVTAAEQAYLRAMRRVPV